MPSGESGTLPEKENCESLPFQDGVAPMLGCAAHKSAYFREIAVEVRYIVVVFANLQDSSKNRTLRVCHVWQAITMPWECSSDFPQSRNRNLRCMEGDRQPAFSREISQEGCAEGMIDWKICDALRDQTK